MTFFMDLSPYRYGRRSDDVGEDQIRNVGWLARGHEVPRGPAPDDLVEALLICATRPVHEYLGSHDCDLCDVAPVSWVSPSGLRVRDPHPASRMQLDGREVQLGNGEIRVQGSDGRWYAAPTLVAHYVAAHQYVPPMPFVDGVRARAKTIYVLRGGQLARLRSLDLAGQIDAAVRVLRAVATHERVEVEPFIPRLLAVVRGDAPCEPLDVPALDETATSEAWWTIASWLGPEHRDTTTGMIALLELAADAAVDVADV